MSIDLDALTAIDLFAGCGGASIGLLRAGVKVVADYERDPDALATLAAAELHPVACDLSELDGRTLPAADLWWASPPCQPDSYAGLRRGANDTRDGWPHLMRLLDEAPRPTWLLIETVPGVAARWPALLGELRQRFAAVDARIVDCSALGVAQSRRRAVTVCGPHAFRWPERIAQPAAWGDVLKIRGHIMGSGRTGKCRPRHHTMPAPTITAVGTAWWVEGERRLTVEESAALQGLAGHPLQGSDTSQRRQAGNAVPPRLAEVIARAVLAHYVRPDEARLRDAVRRAGLGTED